jgi:UPF0716 protein FxsA
VPLLLVLLFVVVPLAELYVIIQVGQVIGPWWTIGILLADSILGSLLLKSQGRLAWRRFNEAWRAGRIPQREILDGVLVIFGGALLLTPGFLTDIFGVLLLLPPTRAVIARGVSRAFARSFAVTVAGAATSRRPREPRRPRTQPEFDVEGTATEHEAPAPRLRR